MNKSPDSIVQVLQLAGKTTASSSSSDQSSTVPQELNDNRKAWIAALRSSRFKQGEGLLSSRNGSLCVMGVACQLYADAHNMLLGCVISQGIFPNRVMPIAVAHWLGFKSTCGLLKDLKYDSYNALSQLNDSGRYNFAQLADIIETSEIY